MNDDQILERGGTEEDIVRYAHFVMSGDTIILAVLQK